jgi:hypothetical protein
MASIAGLSLTHTVAKAVIAGIFTSKKPFLRTPKCEDQAAVSQALRLAWQETTLLSLCALALLAMAFLNGGLQDPAESLWMLMLAVQSLPYAATVVTAILSAMANSKRPSAAVLPLPAPPSPQPPPEALSRAA